MSNHTSAEDIATMRSNPGKPLGVILLTIFIDIIGFSIVFPLFPAMLDFYLPAPDEHGRLLARFAYFLSTIGSAGSAQSNHFMASVFFGGFFGSVYSLLQFIFAPIWGKLSDRLGRKPILTFTVLGTTLAYAFWIFANSFWLFLITRMISGIMAGNIAIASAAVADLTKAQSRTKGMALVGVSFSLGFLLGPALGGFLSQVNLMALWPKGVILGIHPFSTVATAAFALSLFNFIWVVERFPETLRYEKDRHWIRAIRFPRVLGIFRVSIFPIRKANLTNFFFIFALSGMEFTLVFFAVERFQYTSTQNGLMFVYLGMFLILAQGFIVRRLCPIIGEKKLLTIGTYFGIIAYMGVAFSFYTPIFYLSIACMAISIGLVTPTLNALVSLYAKEHDQGRYLGALRSAGALARGFGPFCASCVYFLFNASVCYIFGAILVLPALYLSTKLPQPQKIESAESKLDTKKYNKHEPA